MCIVQGQVEEKNRTMEIFRMSDGRESEEAREEGERVWDVLMRKGEMENWVYPPWGVRKSLKRWELQRLRGDIGM